MKVTFEFLKPDRLVRSLGEFANFVSAHIHERKRISIVLTLAVILGAWSSTKRFVNKTQPFFPPLMVEQILEYTAAKNFAQRGFIKDWFLVDYSSSPKDEDHPYLYTHQPSGPAVLLGALVRNGVSLYHSRLLFAAITVIGGLFLFFLILQITKMPEVALLATILYSWDYDGTIKYSDHFVHAFTGLNYFGSLAFFYFYLNRKSIWFLAGFIFCLSVGFATTFLSCIPVMVALMALHYLAFHKSIESRTLFRVALGTCIFWGALLFTRNCIVLGPDVAFKDFAFTLGNRIFAWPTKEQMLAFFNEYQIVLWGVGNLESKNLNNWLLDALVVPIRSYWIPLTLIPILYFGTQIDARHVGKRICQIFIIFACTYAWHVIFYAQGSNYFHPPFFRMFQIAVASSAFFLVGSYFRQLGELATIDPARLKSNIRLVAAILLVAVVGSIDTYKSDVRRHKKIRKEARRANYDIHILKPFQELAQIPSGVILTNIDALVVNFFAKDNLVFGGCDLKAITELNPLRCPSSFNSMNTKITAKPDFILISMDFVPGYQTCVADCQVELISRMKRKYGVFKEEPMRWIMFKVTDEHSLSSL